MFTNPDTCYAVASADCAVVLLRSERRAIQRDALRHRRAALAAADAPSRSDETVVSARWHRLFEAMSFLRRLVVPAAASINPRTP